jgi:hypothetical protein
MSNQTNSGQRLQLRDASGHILGYYVPAGEFELHFGNPAGQSKRMETEEKSWEQICKQLTEERDRLRAEVAQLRAERDQYLRSLYSLIPSKFTMNEQEVAALEHNGLTLDQILEDFKPLKGT